MFTVRGYTSSIIALPVPNYINVILPARQVAYSRRFGVNTATLFLRYILKHAFAYALYENLCLALYVGAETRQTQSVFIALPKGIPPYFALTQVWWVATCNFSIKGLSERKHELPLSGNQQRACTNTRQVRWSGKLAPVRLNRRKNRGNGRIGLTNNNLPNRRRKYHYRLLTYTSI